MGFSSSLALIQRGALGAASALAVISLTPGEGRALVVNVGGTDYDVTTFTGTYSDYTSKFSSAYMPWYGSSGDANQFATAVDGGLGYPNSPPGGGNSPFFAYAYDPSGNSGNGSISIWYTYVGGPFPYGRYNNTGIETSTTYTWAQVQPVASGPASVPAPIPILGISALFFYSRKLKKRIRESNATPSAAN